MSAPPDPIEQLYAKGVTDGLPVVPPTRERVAAAVAASGRGGDERVAEVPPNYGRATVERIAVNAVMAGCRPEYLPVVIAAVEAVCDEAFDLHGVSATTNAAAPLLIVNGPARAALGVNCGAGVFGPGHRANATIGRAVRLVIQNVGGARPGVITMSTLAHPGYYTYCIGEWEEESPWESLSAEHGFAPGESTVAAFAGEGPHGVYDHQSRTAAELLTTIAHSLAVIQHHKSTHHGDTVVVLSPEHARCIAADGWGKAEVRRFLWERLRKPVRDLVPGIDGGEGLPEHVLAKYPAPRTETTLVAKLRAPDNLVLVVAGGTAGRFSAVVPGWTFPKASRMVIRRIHPAPIPRIGGESHE
ncbi:MAG: hypothetical protein L0027_15095 [Candidatus Rokubacteria bacterium]|nr:hypothetical protein [Candidatus Rokubacteria bacterium]